MRSPYFIITIDTEGDNLWERPRSITTENARFIPRFQALAEKYALKTTYLTNFEMASSKEFQKFGCKVLRERTGEIGMHLHAWNSPPSFSLTTDDFYYLPYLIEYPKEIMGEKITFLTDLLQSVFGVEMTSHRAGRWGFNSTYARMLSESGYTVDSSITPHVSWKKDLGDPNQSGGTSYYNFPETCYHLDLNDIRRHDFSSPLIEVPVTVTYLCGTLSSFLRGIFSEGSLPARAFNRLISEPVWLRPNGTNFDKMLSILKKSQREKWPYVLFMLHSSELMPGGSPNFVDSDAIEKLYADLEILFKTAYSNFEGCTLSEFCNLFMRQGLGKHKLGLV